MKHRPEIDGLRAVSVVPVLFFHAGFEFFSGGFVGVDVFFVISGYLITSIILTEKEAGRFSLAGFYERRARRILPALFFVMLCSLPFAWMWMFPSQLKDFAESLIAVSVFTSNILFWQTTGYFAPASEELPLLHTWSIAVEEQYYIVYPAFLVLFWTVAKRWIVPVIVLVFIASFGLSELGWRYYPGANFFLSPTRAWEILSGVLCAFYMLDKGEPRGNEWLSSLGLALILGAVFFFDRNTPAPSVYTLFPVVGAALIILFATPDTLTARVLKFPILTGIGLISYSAYLWHLPMFAFARIRSFEEPSQGEYLALIVLSLVLAWISWKYIEAPFRNRQRVGRKTLVRAAISVFVALNMAAVVTIRQDGFLNRYVVSEREAIRLVERIRVERETRPYDNGKCEFHFLNVTDEFINRFEICYRSHGKATIILGDSHAMKFYDALALNSDGGFIVSVSQALCRAHTPELSCPFEEFLPFVSDYNDAISRIIYHQAGFYLFQDSQGLEGSRAFFKRTDIPIYRINKEYIALVRDYLDRLGEFGDVLWAGPIIEPHIDLDRVVGFNCASEKMELKQNLEENFRNLDKVIKKFLMNTENVRYVSTIDSVRFDIENDFYDCDSLYFSDGDHWSKDGEIRFGKRMLEQFLVE